MRYLPVLLILLGCITEPEATFSVGVLQPDGVAVFYADVRPAETIYWTMRWDGNECTGSRKNVVVMEIPQSATEIWWIAEVSWTKDSIWWRPGG